MAHSAADGQHFRTLETLEAAAAQKSNMHKDLKSREEKENDLSGRSDPSALPSSVVPVIQETFYDTSQV